MLTSLSEVSVVTSRRYSCPDLDGQSLKSQPLRGYPLGDGIEILDFFNKVENGLTIDDLPLTDEQKGRMPKYLFIRDEDIDYSDIPELDDEWFKNAKLVNYSE